ncbi:MAG: protein kinase [Deltaproteobacteria bacterium]|nr:protein kinase [Deltaproteobacteria bacterium]
MSNRSTSPTPAIANLELRMPPDVAPGRMIGAFRIEGLLGKGGMGAVYRATDTALDRPVALKLLSPSLGERAGALARFEQEAKSASWVNHDNVVQILSYGIKDGVPYIAMEYLRGETLAARIRKGPMSVQMACDIALPLCSGLHAAHQQGIFHRDLKPSNVILALRPTGETPKLLDFGISKLATGDAVNLTDTGVILGTERYMAPEQAVGNAIDGRVDQFALGVVLYECVTGRHPHEGKAQYKIFADAAKGVYDRPSTLVANLPEGLEALIVRMMASEPAERFPDMRAAGRALLSFASTRIRSLWTEHYVAPDSASAEAVSLPLRTETATTDVMAKTLLDAAINRAEPDSENGAGTEAARVGATTVFVEESADPLSPTRTRAYDANPEADATAIQPLRGRSSRRISLMIAGVLAAAALIWFTLQADRNEPPRAVVSPPNSTPAKVPKHESPPPAAPDTTKATAPAPTNETPNVVPRKMRKRIGAGKVHYTPEGIPVI